MHPHPLQMHLHHLPLLTLLHHHHQKMDLLLHLRRQTLVVPAELEVVLGKRLQNTLHIGANFLISLFTCPAVYPNLRNGLTTDYLFYNHTYFISPPTTDSCTLIDARLSTFRCMIAPPFFPQCQNQQGRVWLRRELGSLQGVASATATAICRLLCCTGLPRWRRGSSSGGRCTSSPTLG